MKVTVKDLVRGRGIGQDNLEKRGIGESFVCLSILQEHFFIPSKAKQFDLELSSKKTIDSVPIWLKCVDFPVYVFGEKPVWKNSWFFYQAADELIEKLNLIPDGKPVKYYLKVYYYDGT